MGKRVKIDMSSAKAEEPPQPQHPLRTASTNSMPNLPSERNSAAGVFPLLPEPIPGPPRRHTIIAPAEEPITQTRLDVALDGSVTGMPEATRPFFISPFPMGSKGAKTVASKVKVQDAPIRVATFGKRDTNTSAPSDATEVELTHELRLAEQRRRREFPRRLTTAVIGGIFAIAPMVLLCSSPVAAPSRDSRVHRSS